MPGRICSEELSGILLQQSHGSHCVSDTRMIYKGLTDQLCDSRIYNCARLWSSPYIRSLNFLHCLPGRLNSGGINPTLLPPVPASELRNSSCLFIRTLSPQIEHVHCPENGEFSYSKDIILNSLYALFKKIYFPWVCHAANNAFSICLWQIRMYLKALISSHFLFQRLYGAMINLCI